MSRARSLARHGDPAALRTFAARATKKRAAKIASKTTAAPAKSTSVTVHVDPKRLTRFRALLTQMQQSRRDESVGFDAYWEAVGAILDHELYVDGGFETADAFLRAVVKEKRRTALRMVRVAKYASPAEEAKYGTSVLDAALSFIEAKLGAPLEGKLPIDFAKLRIPTTRGGKSEKSGKPTLVPLAKASVQEITAATRALLRGTSKSRAHASPVEEMLRSAFRSNGALADVKVRVSQGLLHLGSVPLAALQHLVAILRDVSLEEGSTSAAKPTKPKKRLGAKKR